MKRVVITGLGIVSCIGNDAETVTNNLKNLNVNVKLFEIDQPRSVKTRIICDGHYITRIDDDKPASGMAVLKKVQSTDFSQYDYVVLSDYNKGVLDEAKDIIAHINKYNCKVIVDPKENAWFYENAWLVKPNYNEFHELGFDEWKGNIITTNAGEEIIANIDGVNYEVEVDAVVVHDHLKSLGDTKGVNVLSQSREGGGGGGDGWLKQARRTGSGRGTHRAA